jgi:16S rRNA processing protein RimM
MRSPPSPDAARPAPDADDAPPLPADAVEVARVLGAWGIKGGIRLKAFSADPQALFSTKRWFVEPGERKLKPTAAVRAVQPVLPRLLRITQAREQGEFIVATCQELVDRDAAETMAGARILISRASFPTPDDNEFYWVDLIGLKVCNRDGLEFGTVATLIETGPHCVLSIKSADPDGQDVLIPFVDAYVDRVDREARTIHVDWDPAY